MFEDWKESIAKRFKSKVNLRPKDIRRASIKHKGYKLLFVHSSEQSNSKKAKLTRCKVSIQK